MKLSEFQFSTYSSRTIWVVFAVIGLVVGLFFIPEIIKFQMSLSGKKVARQEAVEPQDSESDDLIESSDVAEKSEKAAEAPAEDEVAAVQDEGQTPSDDARASLEPAALDEISSDLDKPSDGEAALPEGKKKEKIADVPKQKERGGFFSTFKLRADSGGSVPVTDLGRLTGKDVESFFKKGQSDIQRFQEKADIREPNMHELMAAFQGAIETVANGQVGQTIDNDTMRANLVSLSNGILSRMRATKFDRGLMVEWQDIPVVSLITHDESALRYKSQSLPFAPKIFLRSVDIRQAGRQGFTSRPPQFTAEVAFKAADVDRVEVYQQGVRLRNPSLGGADKQGVRILRLNGDATGLWTIVAYDKYGSAPYQKSYLFYPRVKRFRQQPDGSYKIAFRTPAPPNALDRFFLASYTKRTAHDPGVGVF